MPVPAQRLPCGQLATSAAPNSRLQCSATSRARLPTSLHGICPTPPTLIAPLVVAGEARHEELVVSTGFAQELLGLLASQDGRLPAVMGNHDASVLATLVAEPARYAHLLIITDAFADTGGADR